MMNIKESVTLRNISDGLVESINLKTLNEEDLLYIKQMIDWNNNDLDGDYEGFVDDEPIITELIRRNCGIKYKNKFYTKVEFIETYKELIKDIMCYMNHADLFLNEETQNEFLYLVNKKEIIEKIINEKFPNEETWRKNLMIVLNRKLEEIKLSFNQ